jgi:hypothetical protein
MSESFAEIDYERTNMRSHKTRFICALLSLALALAISEKASAQQFERPPMLPAIVLAPATLLSGNGFHVDPQVQTDGLLAHYSIQSDVGTFPANSTEMLQIRVAEIPAIVELTNTSKTGIFAKSIATNAVRPVQAAGQMVMHPVDTVKGLPEGVGRFFGRLGLGAQKIQEAATEPQGAPAGEKAGQVAVTTGRATRDVFGYEQERRELAKNLHVDPYTTNPVLSKQLDDFALVAFRAHVGVTTTMAVFIPGSIAITATRIVSQWVWDTPKADLIVRNENSLEAMGVRATQIRVFANNPQFPLSVQTAFVANLSRLKGVPGQAEAVGLASTAQSEEQARFLTDAVGMLVRYNDTQVPLARLLVRKAIVGQDRNGTIVAEAPVDYVSWTPDVSYFAHRADFQGHQRKLWVTGQLSPLAKRNFVSLGWIVNEHVDPIPDALNDSHQ